MGAVARTCMHKFMHVEYAWYLSTADHFKVQNKVPCKFHRLEMFSAYGLYDVDNYSTKSILEIVYMPDKLDSADTNCSIYV